MFNEFLAALPIIALVLFALYGTVFSVRSFERERGELRKLQVELVRIREENATLRQRDMEREQIVLENRELKAENTALRLALQKVGGISASGNATISVGRDMVGGDVNKDTP